MLIMIKEKTGKEIKLNKNNNFNLKYGSIININPKSIYLNITSWVESNDNGEEKIISKLNKKTKHFLYQYLKNNQLFKDRSIIDLDIKESGLQVGKKSFMKCDITLFTKKNIITNSDEVKMVVTDLMDKLTNDVFLSDKNFKFNLNKK